MAGSVTVTWLNHLGDLSVIVADWVADAADASVPNTDLGLVNGFVTMVTTNPGTPAPTDNYTLGIYDEDGIDVLGGSADDCDTSVSEQWFPLVGTEVVERQVHGQLQLRIADQAVNSAQGQVKVYLRR